MDYLAAAWREKKKLPSWAQKMKENLIFCPYYEDIQSLSSVLTHKHGKELFSMAVLTP